MKPPSTLFCTVANNDYVEGLCVMLFSMHKHNVEFEKYPLKVYYNSNISPLSSDNIEKIKTIHSNTEFSETYLQDAEINEVFLKRKEYQSTYLFFQPFGEVDYEQVVSFDADMLCISDLSPVLKTRFPGIRGVGEFEPSPDYFRINHWIREFSGKSMLDYENPKLALIEKILGYRLNLENSCKNKIKNVYQSLQRQLRKPESDFLFYPCSPINTGFFILGKEARSKQAVKNLMKEAASFLEEHDETKMLLGDQPVINWYKQRAKIPTQLLNYNYNINYNIFSYYNKSTFQNARIFHFTGKYKPWLEAQKKAKPDIYQLRPFKLWEKYRSAMEQSHF